MAKNYIEDGDSIDWTNTTGAVVHSGDLVVVGNLCGVAVGDIPADAPGVLITTGVFSLPKAQEDITLGAALYVADGMLTVSAGDADAGLNVRVGTAWADAAAAEATVAVRLGY
ncbi:DUF2190 family protein [Enterobacter mori]|uniref:DUF2190 family protein n=1 Tax=Enterobacter mori TaxID=539813 RepID=UPI00398B854C